jgi:hypothetical protein
MHAYSIFLSTMGGLFAVSAVVLFLAAVMHGLRRRGRRAAAYLGLTLLAGVVAAGFYFFRHLL